MTSTDQFKSENQFGEKKNLIKALHAKLCQSKLFLNEFEKKKKKRPQFKILTDSEITSHFGGTTKIKVQWYIYLQLTQCFAYMSDIMAEVYAEEVWGLKGFQRNFSLG